MSDFNSFIQKLYNYYIDLEKSKSKIPSKYKRILKTFITLSYNFSNIKKFLNYQIYKYRLEKTKSTKSLNLTFRQVLSDILYEMMSIIGANCYIDNIPSKSTDEQIYYTFSHFGPIGMIIKPSPNTTMIWFLENKHAQQCVEKCHKMMCEDRLIQVYGIQPKKKCIDMEYEWKTKTQVLYFKPHYKNVKIPTKTIVDWWIDNFQLNKCINS